MDNHKDLFEFDLEGQPLADYPPEGSEPVRGQRHSQRHVRKRVRRSGPNVRLIGIAAVVLLILAMLLFLRRDAEPEPPLDLPAEDEPITFQFGDMVLVPIEGMPLNSYDKTAFALDEYGRVTYESDGRRAKTGIDVSTYQKEIDWQAVAANGIDFAILRLGHRGYTKGDIYLDQTFEQNLQGALDAGLEVGVYFFSQAISPEEAEEEADYILNVLDGQELVLPITFDWEFIHEDDARTNDLDGEMITNCAAAFCKRIEDAGYRPAVYFNRTQGYLIYNLEKLKNYTLWLAEYDTVPDFYYHFDLWQYSDAGQVDGIQGNVDMNLYFDLF